MLADVQSHRRHIDSVCDRDSELQAAPSASCTALVAAYETTVQICKVRINMKHTAAVCGVYCIILTGAQY